MKGKKAAQAANRRNWEALTARAETAERRAKKFETELAELRADSENKIATLRRGLAEVKAQRDEVTSRPLAEAMTRADRLRSELDEQRKETEKVRRTMTRVYERFHTLVRGLGFTGTEAMEIVSGDFFGTERVIADGPERKLGDRDRIATLQATRGQRKNSDLSLRNKLIEFLNAETPNDDKEAAAVLPSFAENPVRYLFEDRIKMSADVQKTLGELGPTETPGPNDSVKVAGPSRWRTA